MYEYDYTPSGVCAKHINIILEDDNKTISSIKFLGGCQGNLKAIDILLKGKSIWEAKELLEGITCGNKTTSCADQLANALAEIAITTSKV